MRVFMSYRREDDASLVDRVHDALARRYGSDNVFCDVSDIPYGADFRAEITYAIERADIALVFIGPRWDTRRLWASDDVVRDEIEQAIRRRIPVLPVLLGDVRMPPTAAFPPALAGLPGVNAPRVRREPDFPVDVQRLVEAIEQLVPKPYAGVRPEAPIPVAAPAHRGGPGTLVALAATVAVVAAAVAFVVRNGDDGDQMRSLWTRLVVVDDGSGQVLEAIDWDFAGTGDHGINRGLNPGWRAPITVDSPDAPATFVTQPLDDGGLRVRVGDPSVEVTGAHRYEVGYGLDAVVQGATLDWEAYGTEWDVEVGRVEAHVISPFELEDVRCFVGHTDDSSPCDEVREVEPGHVVAVHGRLDAHEGLSIEGAIGEELQAPPATAVEAPAPSS